MHTSRAAVETAAQLFDRHEEEVAVNRYVTLTAGAHDRRELPRLAGVLDVVDVEPVKVADEDLALTKGDVGISLIQVIGTWPRRRVSAGSLMFALEPADGVFLFTTSVPVVSETGRRLRIEEPFGLRKARNEFHIAGGGSRITKARPEADARVSGSRGLLLGASRNPGE